MKVTNYDKSGKIIEDMRKVMLPEKKQNWLIKIFYSEKVEVENEVRFREKEISS